MASVNWEKQTKQKAGAMRRHNGKEERVRLNHSNPDIDKSKSNLNYYIGCDDYKDAYEAMCKRVDEVDKQYPPERKVKDRVVCVSLEAKCPQEIFNAGRSEEFFNELHKVYEKFFGAENVHGSCVHLDEMHSYVENGAEKMSLAHAHTLVSAYAEWQKKDKQGNVKERKGINGKNCETKARLKALNEAVCDMVREKFGVEYNTGEKSKCGRTVEELKAKQGLEKIKKETEDYVRSITPSATKKVKGFLGAEKEIKKTAEEIARDRDVALAQSVLKERDQIISEAKKKEKQVEEEKNKLQSKEKELAEKSKQLNEKEKKLNEKSATIKAKIEREVLKRLARIDPQKNQREEDERFLLRQLKTKEAAEKSIAKRKTKGEFER